MLPINKEGGRDIDYLVVWERNLDPLLALRNEDPQSSVVCVLYFINWMQFFHVLSSKDT